MQSGGFAAERVGVEARRIVVPDEWQSRRAVCGTAGCARHEGGGLSVSKERAGERRPVGLLAGDGALPISFARAAKEYGWSVVAIGVSPHVRMALADEVAHFEQIPITKWAAVVDALKAGGVRDVVVLGKVSKTLLFSERTWDERFRRVVESVPEGGDHALLLAFTADLASEGLIVAEQSAVLPGLFPRASILSKRHPDPEEWQDIEFAFRMAKGVSGLDIGQTVVVKRRVVLAVEAIEGTDETIRRGCALGGGGGVVVKVARPEQDMRFDVPTIGAQTMQVMRESGARLLAFEADRTFVVERAELLQAADEAGIAVVAYAEGMGRNLGAGDAECG